MKNNNYIQAIPIKDNVNDTFGEIDSDGFFAKNVAEQMLKSDASITEDIVSDVFSNASAILNECPNPSKSGEFHKTGIVIGKVQSGKTSNFIALLALAFDNGYNLAVVIGGNTTELLTQNVERIKNSFNVGTDKLIVLHSRQNDAQITPDNIRSFIRNGQKVLIVTLISQQTRNNRHMSKVSELFDDPIMAQETTIIIDDEGDQATLNAKVYSKDSDVEKRVSATYKVAIELKQKIKRHCFISITATPQANILIKTSDKLSPDFGRLIPPGRGYCGLSTFHGEEQDKYVKVIPDCEDSLLDGNAGSPSSFYDALSAFYVSSAIKKSRGDNKIHSMLIHPSVRKYDHELARQKVDYLLEHWRCIIRLGKTDVSYENSLRPLFLKAYEMYVNDGVKTKPFDELEETIRDSVLKSSGALVFNSDQKYASSDASLFSTRIYLGGAILDRGITISGLTITYIIRRAKGYQNVDNTEQRARWFGYKNVPYHSDYIDLCRVWATQPIKDDFASINESDEEMWASIERNLNNGVKFKDLPRIFMLQYDASHKLRLTRPNVARTKQLVSWTEWKRQDFYVYEKKDANHNFELLENYRKTCSGFVKDHGGDNKNFYVYDILFGEFINQVLSKFKFLSRDSFNIDILNKLLGIIRLKKMDEYIDLCWVRFDAKETRTIKSDYTIAAPFYRGRDVKQNEQGGYDYLGDRSTCNDRPKKIQIQIHYVKAKNHADWNFYSPVICIYVPEEYAVTLVGKDNERD